MQDEGFHLPSQEAKAALNSATSLCKWFDSDQTKDMVEEFNKALKNFFEGMHPECSAARQWCGLSACGRHSRGANWEAFFMKAGIPPNALVYHSSTMQIHVAYKAPCRILDPPSQAQIHT